MKEENNSDVSIIFPCRNEEKALPLCLKKAKEVIKENKINAEIIVSDSSSDKSPEIAKKEKAILVKHDKVGYGNAYLEGIKAAKGKYILMVDADCTYDLNDIPKFIYYLSQGYDLVIGNRFKKNMQKRSMPFSHKYIGNPILSGILRNFFNCKIGDAHCGIRAIKKEALEKLNLQTTGMEFASEMIIKACKQNLKMKEFPVNYYKRVGKSKLNTYSDGYRHLRFMLLYSPLYLFFIPGIILFLIGAALFSLFLFTNPKIAGITLYIHPQFINTALILIGYQLIFFSIFAKTYLTTHLKEPESKIIKSLYKKLNLETGILSGLLLALLGIIIFLIITIYWLDKGPKPLNQINNFLIALIFTIVGVQTVFNSFMLSILGIKEK
jgi:glycosyltransferase involved in cell wall biosynthesis